MSYTSDVIDDVVSSKFKPVVVDGEQPGYSIYDQDDKLRFFHSVKKDGNLTSQNAPLAVKITVMSPGTVISIFFEHTVVDGKGASIFYKSWSRVFKGLDLDGEHAPDYKRNYVLDLKTEEKPFNEMFVEVSSPMNEETEKIMKILPTVNGRKFCMVPFTKAKLNEMKTSANVDLPAGTFVSTNDVLTATIVKAVIKTKCTQLDIPIDSDEPVVVWRSINVRPFKLPNLTQSNTCNAVSLSWISLTVGQVMSMSVKDLGLALRSQIKKWTREKVVAEVQLRNEAQAKGLMLQYKFSRLTLVVTSLIFPGLSWEDAEFEGNPFFYVQRSASTCVGISPREGQDGNNVWWGGKQEAVELFAKTLTDL